MLTDPSVSYASRTHVANGVTTPVAVLLWPSEQAEIALLRATGMPRLLLVEADGPAPELTDCCEDWARLPVSEDDLRIRTAAVAGRAIHHLPRPRTNGDGRIVFGGKWVPLSRLEEALALVLCEQFGEVVAFEQLVGSSDGHTMSANAVRVHIMRLRRRIQALGLHIENVHGHGYVLERATA